VYTNDSASIPKSKTYTSTSLRLNRKFLINKYLTYYFSSQTYCPRKVSSRYFKQLSSLLIAKFDSLNSHLQKDLQSSRRQTKTYIKFSFKCRTIYLGFYFQCDHAASTFDCNTPAPCVMSGNRWRCPHHKKNILPIPPPPKSPAALPSPPCKSMKPRCSRAGTETVTLSAMGAERLTPGAPRFFAYGFRPDAPALAIVR
jgi:hypothetical protein